MNRHIVTLTAATAVAAALPAYATSGYTRQVGEAGGTTHAMPSSVSRSQVQAELDAWKRNPVTADGWREVGGEAGWVYVGRDTERTLGNRSRTPFDGQGQALSRSGHQGGATSPTHGHR